MPMLDTTYAKDFLGTFISDLVLQIMSFCAQLEREKILHRQADGIAAAKEKGVKFGRPEKEMPENFADILSRWENKNITAIQAATLCGLSRSTFYDKTRGLRTHNV
jgi:DNA invertase Pin-like site-specific DNA recombinase